MGRGWVWNAEFPSLRYWNWFGRRVIHTVGGSAYSWQGPEAMENLCVQLQNEMEYGFLSESWSNEAEVQSYREPEECSVQHISQWGKKGNGSYIADYVNLVSSRSPSFGTLLWHSPAHFRSLPDFRIGSETHLYLINLKKKKKKKILPLYWWVYWKLCLWMLLNSSVLLVCFCMSLLFYYVLAVLFHDFPC